VVHPVKADQAGRFLSNNLQHVIRQRRSLGKPNEVFYKMDALGRSLHLKVRKSDDVLAPGAKIQTTEADGSTTTREPLRANYYQGHVVSDPDSKVAISNDGGLVSKGFFLFITTKCFRLSVNVLVPGMESVTMLSLLC
jgi:hypothetical protein